MGLGDNISMGGCTSPSRVVRLGGCLNVIGYTLTRIVNLSG